MNAPEYINDAHEALLRADDALSVTDVAREIHGTTKPNKTQIKAAERQLKELNGLGLIAPEFRTGGVAFYRLIVAPAVQVGGAGVADIAQPAECVAASGDSEGGETDAQREEFTLLGLIADIRAAAGDPDGRLMQDELVQHIAGVVKERDDLRERLDAQIQQWQTDTGRLAADLRAAMESRSQAINEADRLRAELATERQAREALQEQSGVIQAAGYLVRAGETDRTFRLLTSARREAERLARRQIGRVDVLALVPAGSAKRVKTVQWRDA